MRSLFANDQRGESRDAESLGLGALLQIAIVAAIVCLLFGGLPAVAIRFYQEVFSP